MWVRRTESREEELREAFWLQDTVDSTRVLGGGVATVGMGSWDSVGKQEDRRAAERRPQKYQRSERRHLPFLLM